MNYTIDFVLWVQTVSFARLKFINESRFNSFGKFFVKLVLFSGKLIIFVFSDFQSCHKYIGPVASKRIVKAV